MDHLEPVRRRIREAVVAEPPPPWARLAVHSVGGLTGVGIAEGTDWLLVVSHQGRGVFDLRSGERVARDDSSPDESWYDRYRSRATGIGPLSDQTIRLAGLHGGGLSNSSRSGWRVESVTLEWPDQHLLLYQVSPRGIYGDDAHFTKLMMESEVRAFGFSDDGATLIIATSSDLSLYRLRDETDSLDAELMKELDRRKTNLMNNPGLGLTWGEVFGRVRGCHGR